MPFTPLHLGFAWPVWLLNRRKLHFMSLSFGAMVPDLEVLPLMMLNSEGEKARGFMHSFLGAVTVDLLIVMFIVLFVVPPVGKWIRRRYGGRWHIFAGVDVTRPPRDILWALGSALIGTLSHVIIDAFTHPYNPLLWPHYTGNDFNWMPFPDDPLMSSMLFSIPLGIITLLLATRYWTRPFKL